MSSRPRTPSSSSGSSTNIAPHRSVRSKLTRRKYNSSSSGSSNTLLPIRTFRTSIEKKKKRDYYHQIAKKYLGKNYLLKEQEILIDAVPPGTISDTLLKNKLQTTGLNIKLYRKLAKKIHQHYLSYEQMEIINKHIDDVNEESDSGSAHEEILMKKLKAAERY
jgi:hypothetical protein